jgi:hypothetical protein
MRLAILIGELEDLLGPRFVGRRIVLRIQWRGEQRKKNSKGQRFEEMAHGHAPAATSISDAG